MTKDAHTKKLVPIQSLLSIVNRIQLEYVYTVDCRLAQGCQS